MFIYIFFKFHQDTVHPLYFSLGSQVLIYKKKSSVDPVHVLLLSAVVKH